MCTYILAQYFSKTQNKHIYHIRHAIGGKQGSFLPRILTARGLSDSLTPTPVARSKPGLTPSTGLAANSTACKLVMLKDEDPWGVRDTVWMRQKCSVGRIVMQNKPASLKRFWHICIGNHPLKQLPRQTLESGWANNQWRIMIIMAQHHCVLVISGMGIKAGGPPANPAMFRDLVQKDKVKRRPTELIRRSANSWQLMGVIPSSCCCPLCAGMISLPSVEVGVEGTAKKNDGCRLYIIFRCFGTARHFLPDQVEVFEAVSSADPRDEEAQAPDPTILATPWHWVLGLLALKCQIWRKDL